MWVYLKTYLIIKTITFNNTSLKLIFALMQDLVTIYIAMYPQDVLVLRARLESENIECFVQDELTLQTNPFYSNAIGGVRLQVKKEDAEQAKGVLREGGYVPEGEDFKVVDSLFNRLFNKYSYK